MCNAAMFNALKGSQKCYPSQDTGQPKHIKKILAPRFLVVKDGVPVILLLNLSQKLVNGLQGVVKKFSDDVVTVYFPAIMQYATIKRETFTVFSNELGVNVATRIQFPLSLAYAVTIHKAQGMTLDAVQVSCYMVNVHDVHPRNKGSLNSVKYCPLPYLI